MNIVVCFKQVIDPEAPPAAFRLDPATHKAEMRGAPPVIDPYGEYAVEAALKIRDAAGGKVTAVTMGANLLGEVVKKPLAMGADELVLLESEDYNGADSYATAYALAMAVRKVAAYDLILCGREASDTNAGQTGIGIAGLLGLPCVTLARRIDIKNDTARVERVTGDGYAVVEAALPAVITVSHEIGEPRYPTIMGIMAAGKIDPAVWAPEDIGADVSRLGRAGRRTDTIKLFQPVHEGRCEMVTGGSPGEAGANLAMKLREDGII